MRSSGFLFWCDLPRGEGTMHRMSPSLQSVSCSEEVCETWTVSALFHCARMQMRQVMSQQEMCLWNMGCLFCSLGFGSV